MATPITRAEISALDYGYIVGTDLLIYWGEQLIKQQYAFDPLIIDTCIKTAIQEIKAKLSSKYDFSDEFDKTGDSRDLMLVKLVATCAKINLYGGNNNLDQSTTYQAEWYKCSISEIQQGILSFPNIKLKDSTLYSGATLVDSSYTTLG